MNYFRNKNKTNRNILYIKNKLLFFNFSKRNNFSMQSWSLSDKLTLYKLYFHDRSDIYINYFIIEDGVINNNWYLYFFYNKILPSLSGDTKISLLSSYARYITTIIFKNNNNEHFLFLWLYILLICIEKVKKNYEEKDFLYLYLWISFIFIELKMYKEAIIFLKYHILKTLFYFNIVTWETLVAILKSYLKIKNYSWFDKIYLKINTLSYYYARNNYNEIVWNNFLGNRFKLYHYKTQREFELWTNKKFLAYHFISVYLYTVQISKWWESSNFRFIINNVSYNKQLTDKLLDESYRSRYNVFINRTMRNKIYTVIFNLYILVKMNENSTDIKYSCWWLEKYSFQYVKYYLS